MLTFILTFTCIGLIAGGCCGALAYEGRDRDDHIIQTLCSAGIGACALFSLSMLLCSALINGGITL